MARIHWTIGDENIEAEAECTREQLGDFHNANALFREKRRIRQRIGGDMRAFVTAHGYARSFPYPFDKAAIGASDIPAFGFYGVKAHEMIPKLWLQRKEWIVWEIGGKRWNLAGEEIK